MKHIISLPQLSTIKRTVTAGGASLMFCLVGMSATASAGVMYPGPTPVLVGPVPTTVPVQVAMMYPGPTPVLVGPVPTTVLA